MAFWTRGTGRGNPSAPRSVTLVAGEAPLCSGRYTKPMFQEIVRFDGPMLTGNGRIPLRDAPGIGVDIDVEALARGRPACRRARWRRSRRPRARSWRRGGKRRPRSAGGRRNAHARGAAATREVAGLAPDLRGDVELGTAPALGAPSSRARRPPRSTAPGEPGGRGGRCARSAPSTRARTAPSPSGRRKWIQAEVSTRTIASPAGAGAAAPPRSRAPGRSRLAWRARPSGGAR